MNHHRPPVAAASRWLAAVLIGATVSLTGAAPAFAHTKVQIDPARAGATNALVTVVAEAESDAAGVAKVQIFPPAGIAPTDVTLVRVPKGWTLSVQADSYTVAGPPLPVGVNAEHQVRVRQLPNTRVIAFRILQSYSDGQVNRWIEIPSEANPEPANPAPTVTLSAAPAPLTTTPLTATTAPATPAAPTAAATTGPAVAAGGDGNRDEVELWRLFAAGALVAAVGAATFLLRRRRPPAA